MVDAAVLPRARWIDPKVLGIIETATFAGLELRLPESLDQATYRCVNTVLEAVGGAWDRKRKAHIFPSCARTAVEPILLTGTLTGPREFGCFYTPPAIADRVIVAADIARSHRVLEPSAGLGALAAPAARRGAQVDCVELLPANVAILEALGIGFVDQGDFLGRTPERVYDRVVMNPPFADQADIAHVNHAFRFLKPGGLLVAVMAAGLTYRKNAATRQMRDLVELRRGSIAELPPDAFRIAGTSVRTVLVTLRAYEAQP